MFYLHGDIDFKLHCRIQNSECTPDWFIVRSFHCLSWERCWTMGQTLSIIPVNKGYWLIVQSFQCLSWESCRTMGQTLSIIPVNKGYWYLGMLRMTLVPCATLKQGNELEISSTSQSFPVTLNVALHPGGYEATPNLVLGLGPRPQTGSRTDCFQYRTQRRKYTRPTN